MNRWFVRARQRFDQFSLAAQIGGVGVLAALASAGGVLGLARTAPNWPLAIGIVVGGGLAMALVGAGLAHRAARGLHSITEAARALSQVDAAPELDIPLVACTAELSRASDALRRMLEAARRRQQALEVRAAAFEQRLNTRTHELTTLQDLSIGLTTTADVKSLVDEALLALGHAMDYASASLWARGDRAAGGRVTLLGYRSRRAGGAPDDDDLNGMGLSRANLQRYEQIERDRVPIIENHVKQSLFSWLWSKVTDDARSSELYRASRSWMALPLAYRSEVLGVIRVDHDEPEFFDPERARLLTAVGSQAALALHHAQLQTQQREVAVIAERNRIARDLHDAVSQTLFAASVLAGTLARNASRQPPLDQGLLATQAETLEKLNRGALTEMRMLMFELRPDALASIPLGQLLQNAVEALACRGDLNIDSSLAQSDSLAPEVRVHLYRIAQEALSNVARHSRALHCRVSWSLDASGRGCLRIADDGCGFDPDQATPGHFGLDNMFSRAREIGATLSLVSRPDEGTEVIVEWKSATA
jgi:signal transduction histidine kinase